MPEPRVSTGKVEPVEGQIELPFEPPMTMQISQADQDHQNEMRARSYRLAIERGHLRR